MRCIATALLSLSLLLGVAGVANAQLFSDKEARAKARENQKSIENIAAIIRDLNNKIEDLTQKNKNLTQQLAILTQDLQAQKDKIRSLNGNAEVLKNALENVETTSQADIQQIQSSLSDLFSNIRQLEENIAQNAVQNEIELIAQADEHVASQRYSEAIETYQLLLSNYPNSANQPQILLNLSNLYFLQADYPSALALSEQLTNTPTAPTHLLPDAFLIFAKSLLQLDREAEGYKKLAQILLQYPDAPAAQEARAILE